MDPDALLEELRALYNSYMQDGDDRPEIIEEFFECFDSLDNWLSSSGFLPSAWTP